MQTNPQPGERVTDGQRHGTPTSARPLGLKNSIVQIQWDSGFTSYVPRETLRKVATL